MPDKPTRSHDRPRDVEHLIAVRRELLRPVGASGMAARFVAGFSGPVVPGATRWMRVVSYQLDLWAD